MLHQKFAYETFFLTLFLIGSANGELFVFDLSAGSSHSVNNIMWPAQAKQGTSRMQQAANFRAKYRSTVQNINGQW